jgi:hypothetical protein
MTKRHLVIHYFPLTLQNINIFVSFYGSYAEKKQFELQESIANSDTMIL